MKEFGAIDASGQPPRDGHASEKRTASGTSSGEWLVNVSGDVVVPMSATEIAQGVRSGKLSDRSLVWRIGMHDWTILADVPQLRLATGATLPPPVSATRVAQPPIATQAESQRRRNTLPFGFPAVRDPASIRQPVGLSVPSASATPISAPRSAPPSKPKEEDEVEALAVYDRPAASLTFSDSVRAEWQGTSRIVHQQAQPSVPPARASVAPPSVPTLSPAPVVAARLPEAARSGYPGSAGSIGSTNSLVPLTADAGKIPDSRAPNAWGDRSVVFASELRAVKKTSKRVALWAAVGSAALASVFTLWLMRAPPPHAPAAALAPAPKAAAQPIIAAPLEAIAPPSEPASATPLPVPKKVVAAPRSAAKRARPKPIPASDAPASDTPAPSDNPYAQGTESSVPTPAATSGAAPATIAPAANLESAPTAADPSGL